MDVIKRLVVRNCQIRKRLVNDGDQDLESCRALLCNNIEWNEATDRVMLGQACSVELTADELLCCAELIKCNVGIELQVLIKKVRSSDEDKTPNAVANAANQRVSSGVMKKCAYDLAQNLPVLILSKKNEFVVLDIHNFVYTSDLFTIIENSSTNFDSETKFDCSRDCQKLADAPSVDSEVESLGQQTNS